MATQQKNRLIPPRISIDMLDTIGRNFRFKHSKGIAEWLKNSLDQYLRLREVGSESRAGSWPVIINLIDGRNSSSGPNLAVLDFGGTDYSKIEEFFLHWGDRGAATHGRAVPAAVTGGHGNGGKFYMREMWGKGARFLTWRGGRVTSLVVEKRTDGNVGEWEFENVPMPWRDALNHALAEGEGLGGNSDLLRFLADWDPGLIAELEQQQRGFSVVVGRRGRQLLSSNDVVRAGRWDRQRLIDDIRDAPQARRPIRELNIAVLANGAPILHRLVAEAIDEDKSWPERDLPLPSVIVEPSVGKLESDFAGRLRILTSCVPLTGRKRDLNSVHVMDRNGNPIAFYPVSELPLPGSSTVLSLLHAELGLEFPQSDDLVQNDRERLVPSPTTEAVLRWVSEQVWDHAQSIESSQRANERKSSLLRASVLNEAFNLYATQFLEELQTEIFVDFIEDPAGGGPGAGGDGRGPTGKGPGGERPRTDGVGGGTGEGGSKEEIGDQQSIRRPKFPQVLLSGTDEDPASSTGESKAFTASHPPLNQDDTDRRYNVWWINTTHPFAEAALQAGGPEGAPFKHHQLSMFRDVVQREALRLLQRREAELGLDRVENELDEISNKFLNLPVDLVRVALSPQQSE